jgi:DNA-binding MarR family transcriptional regulator
MQQLMRATIESNLSERCASQALLAIPMVMRFMRAQMRGHRQKELTVPQFRALIFVQHHPEAALSPMAEHIGLSLPAASRMVDLLVRRGLLLRRADPRDRRCIRLALTARGRSVYRIAQRATQSALAERFASTSPRDLKLVSRALELLAETFEVRGNWTPGVSVRKNRSGSRAVG